MYVKTKMQELFLTAKMKALLLVPRMIVIWLHMFLFSF